MEAAIKMASGIQQGMIYGTNLESEIEQKMKMIKNHNNKKMISKRLR